MDDFTSGYIECALWSSSADLGGTDLGATDLTPEALARMEADCAKFQEQVGSLIVRENCNYHGCSADAYSGHDFWLTRNGHGCGFWDGDWQEPAATALDRAAESFGSCDLYIGDDGKVYLS